MTSTTHCYEMPPTAVLCDTHHLQRQTCALAHEEIELTAHHMHARDVVRCSMTSSGGRRCTQWRRWQQNRIIVTCNQEQNTVIGFKIITRINLESTERGHLRHTEALGEGTCVTHRCRRSFTLAMTLPNQCALPALINEQNYGR